MPCNKPLMAYKCGDGSVVFKEMARHNVLHEIKLPCGQCTGCKIDRAREWSVRCMHEAKMHEYNSFLTLTYNDEHVPLSGSLEYRHFQLFMKRLRESVGAVRFFMCGEYGEENGRPHYHALIFGYDFPDKKYWRKSPGGYPLYRSAELEKLWTFGNAEIGTVTMQSAGYCARYALKKVNGGGAKAHYGDRAPEFCRMSLKPGIGAKYFERYGDEVFPDDFVVADGVKVPVPRYYEKLYKGELEDVKSAREVYGAKFAKDNVAERLSVREEVLNAKVKFLKRTI